MPYLVDGHNLIPHIPGLSLKDLDDERSLVELLGHFGSQKGTRVEVYFDQAPPSRGGSQTFGRVKAHYIRQGATADQAIISRLNRLGRSAKNWTVVSSDRVILAEARSFHCAVVRSGEFAALIRKTAAGGGAGADKAPEPEIDDREVDYWLDQFSGK